MPTSEQKAWDALARLDPAGVCARAPCAFDRASRVYTLESFGQSISLSLSDRVFSSPAPLGSFILSEFKENAEFSFLSYLLSAKNTPLSGRLVKPGALPGGDIYERGTHRLPLDRLAQSYSGDPAGLLQKARMFGAAPLSFGDAAARLFPLPRLPVVIILHAAGDEFPARADLLLDSTCTDHLPLDAIWSTAVMTVLLMVLAAPPPA